MYLCIETNIVNQWTMDYDAARKRGTVQEVLIKASEESTPHRGHSNRCSVLA